MNIPRTALVVTAVATMSTLASCSSVQDDRTTALENRIKRQDERIEARSTRRRMRAEAQDRRHNDWFDRVMGRPARDW
jgi:hypothetical protein